ncbi:MAG TPA: NTP transferase domain-containing protein [Planctomycetota bacterium]|nr:NTP transferase domain-containing protein [Planctomycetota bacterium]
MIPARAALSVLVLAGGEGRRLGGRKDGLPFGDGTLLQRALDLAASLSDDVVCAPGRWPAPAGLTAGVRVVADDARVEGPLAGLLAGLAATRHDACLLLPCDMPFARADVARRLLALATGPTLVAALHGPGGREPFHAVWRRGSRPVLEALAARGQRSLQAALDALQERGALALLPEAELTDLDAELACLINVNTAADLAAARARVARRGA